MKKLFAFSIIIFLFLAMNIGQTAEKAPQEVIDYARNELVKLGVDPIIVKAVKAENAKKKTLDAIKAMDKKWRETSGSNDFMKALMDSPCGKHLRMIRESKKFLEEIFVMDNLGANVAMTDKTSDYWQGDEDKFTKSFNKGQGAVHIGDVEFDDSAQAYLIQVSVPVKDVNPDTKKETVIGAITIGINIDNYK